MALPHAVLLSLAALPGCAAMSSSCCCRFFAVAADHQGIVHVYHGAVCVYCLPASVCMFVCLSVPMCVLSSACFCPYVYLTVCQSLCVCFLLPASVCMFV